MDERKKQLYKLIFNMALTYRLSLDNICILLGKEVNETNKKDVYDACMYLYEKNIEIRKAFEYLFNFETLNESKEVSALALDSAKSFMSVYKEACNSGDKDRIRETKSSLLNIDKDFKKILNMQGQIPLTKENMLVISKYRIKYGLSRKVISRCIGVHHTNFIRKEQEIEDEIIKNKLKILSEYHLDIVSRDKRNVR